MGTAQDAPARSEKGLLKFIACGSVDDGKSTLIGHMLYDAKLIFADQERALELDSKLGSRGGSLDYSLLLDGLTAEREQGITIDVAYRYFTTEKRSFIVADTPGHEEYTRNMAVGASFADVAVILVDATQGVLMQTRRHTRICSLMGIRHFVFAVNKMDLIDYDRGRFSKIEREIRMMTGEYDIAALAIMPVSATEGDNVNTRSKRMPWYDGKPLLAWLEDVDVEQAAHDVGFTLPVQRVCRPDRTFRGFCGQVESGSVRTGQDVTVLPSSETAHVTRILDAGRDVEEAAAGHAVTVTLDREMDISRGCVLVSEAHAKTTSMFRAKILWMDDARLVAGKGYLLKLGTRQLPATVMNIKCKIDVNTGDELNAKEIYKNEIALCDIATAEKIVLDEFGSNQALGSLILIDRVTNMTSACGTVMHTLRRSDNLTWHDMDITREFRAEQLAQHPKTIWLTGLSGSGKSTLANELEKRLTALGKHTMLLDGDNVRMGLNTNLGFTEADRIENIRRIAEVAKLMNDAGLIVITSFISPYARDRRRARDIIGQDSFVEVHVSTPLAACEARDVKGLYARARAGEIPNFTGISSPYEAPEHPFISIDTSTAELDACVDALMEAIEPLV